MVTPRDNDTIEMRTIPVPEGLDLFDVSEPAGGTPEASAVTATPAEAEAGSATSQAPGESTPPAAESAPILPAWLADIPEAERAGVIASGLAALSPEQRLALAPVQELVGQVQNLTAAQVQQAQQNQQAQQQRDQAIAYQAQTLADRIDDFAPVDFEVRQELDGFGQAIRQDYHARLVGQIETGILEGYGRLGMSAQNLPPALVAAVRGAQNYQGVIKAYVDAAADRAFELGRLKERDDAANRSKADETALRARVRNEVLGQLNKEGRVQLGKDDNDGFYTQLINDTPPSLSGTPVPVSGDLDQAEFDEAMRDPDAYDRLMGDPAKAAALKKLLAGALGGQ